MVPTVERYGNLSEYIEGAEASFGESGPNQLPSIPESARTPLVIAPLDVTGGLAERVQKQEEEIALLKDGNRRTHFKPVKMDDQTDEGARDRGADQERR